MSSEEINLIGKVCPYCVMHIIKHADMMRNGEIIKFEVDDPLATKSVPVELEDYDDITYSITKHKHSWEIVLNKE